MSEHIAPSLKAAFIELLVHIFVGSIVFLLIACFSALIDLFLILISDYNVSDFLISMLSWVKKGILVLDVILLTIFLINISFKFVTSLDWDFLRTKPRGGTEL